LTASDRARDEILRAAQRAVEVEQDLRSLSDQMIAAGASPDLDCQEAIEEAASRLRLLSESLAA